MKMYPGYESQIKNSDFFLVAQYDGLSTILDERNSTNVIEYLTYAINITDDDSRWRAFIRRITISARSHNKPRDIARAAFKATGISVRDKHIMYRLSFEAYALFDVEEES